MANIFVDANILIDLAEGGRAVFVDHLFAHHVFVSPLSAHILAYTHKYNMPHEKLRGICSFFSLVEINTEIIEKALQGPTKDLEDNIQLQSAATVDCAYFLTLDKDLLKLGVFGTMTIARSI